MADTKAKTKSGSSTGEKVPHIDTLDFFRALMMFLMIFVNDIPGLKDIPSWLLHAAENEDRLGFSDVIFPGFLFAMGMAIPYALETRRSKGEELWKIIGHVLLRTAALLIMGVFIVNYDTIGKAKIPKEWFGIGMIVAFFLIWDEYPKWKGYLVWGLRIAGLGLLVYLFTQYKGRGGAAFEPQWWGILGLIGWCYLICAVVVLFTRFNLLLTFLATAIAIAICIFPNEDWVKHLHLAKLSILFPSGAVLNTFALMGLLTGVLIKVFDEKANFCSTLLPILGGLTIGLLAAAYWARHHWIISKAQATPTWLFLCSAILIALFVLLYWVIEVAGKKQWFRFLSPAAVATLTCYMIPYLWYSIQSLAGLKYPSILNSGYIGLLRSLGVAFAVLLIVWILTKIKIRLKI